MGRTGSVAPGRELSEATPELWARATRDLEAVREQLRSVPLEDRSTWAHVARDTAGVFAAWSRRVEATPGPLARAADMLARSGTVRAGELQPRPPRMPSPSSAAHVMRVAVDGGQGTVAEALMWRQLAATTRALFDLHTARGEAQSAANVARMVRDQLRAVDARMPALPEQAEGAAAATLTRTGQVPLAPGPARQADGPQKPAARPASPDLQRPKNQPDKLDPFER